MPLLGEFHTLKCVENCIGMYLSAGAQSEIFNGREGFVKLGHFSKHFVKNSKKKAPQGKFRSSFS